MQSARRLPIVLFLSLGLGLGGCVAPPDGTSPTPVAEVDIERYMGLWYEIASYPAPFQLGCTNTTAEYALRDDGTVTVRNCCDLLTPGGFENCISGSARAVDPATNAQLKVSFGFGEGDYWIIELDDDYQWAVVSEPGRRLLWILARTPQIDDATYMSILERISEQGFDLGRLNRTTQQAASARG